MSTNPKKTEETPPPENVTPIKKPSSFSRQVQEQARGFDRRYRNFDGGYAAHEVGRVHRFLPHSP